MLILTRRIGEAMIIGDDITIMVLEVQGNQVRLKVRPAAWLLKTVTLEYFDDDWLRTSYDLTMPIRNWKAALNRFMIEYEDRLVDYV